jgi:hypothetical protein
MVGSIEKTDILLSYDTDIAFGIDDLMIVSGSELLKRKIFKHLITEFNDWKIHPQVGSSPNRFTGERNNRETASNIKYFIENNINPHISPAQITVKVVPIDYDSIKIYITAITEQGNGITMPFSFDYINGLEYTQVDTLVDKIISNVNIKINDSVNIDYSNPYLSNIGGK